MGTGGAGSLLGCKRRRRRRLRRTPLEDAGRAVLARNLAWYARFSAGERRTLEGLVQVFLDEKRFEGCGGLRVSDEMRLTIAAQACLLLLRLPDPEVYPGLHSILVYPHAYVAPVVTNRGGIVTEVAHVRLGQSWSRGSLVLSWDDVRRNAVDVHDGHNVVLHEFAHQLDQQDGVADGTPPLPDRSRHLAWARVLGSAYADLLERIHEQRPSVIDTYGATSPAEFFAVVTECFFERPIALGRSHPALYAELQRFYRQDPAARERLEPEGMEDAT